MGDANGNKYEKIDLPKEPAKAPVPTAPVKPGEKPEDPSVRVLGIDVAKYQDKLDPTEWAKLYAKGYRFVFAKATDGKAGLDSYYSYHRKNAKAAGFLVGAYHFLRYGYTAEEQASHHFKTAGRVSGELPSVLDVEWDRYTLDQKYGSDKRMDKWAENHAKKYVETLMLLNGGKKPIIYTNAYFWPEKCSFPEFWSQFLVWVPSYSDSLNPGGKHVLADLSPAEIAKAGAGVKIPSGWKQWNFWQDDDDLAIGDVKAIDTNVFRGSLEDLRKMANA